MILIPSATLILPLIEFSASIQVWQAYAAYKFSEAKSAKRRNTNIVCISANVELF